MNSIINNTNIHQKKHLLDEIDKCVACGLCLPSCPTYATSQKESQSPRGRIILAKGMIEEHIEINQQSYLNIEQCLHCGNCVRVCPANVPYAEIIDATKNLLSQYKNLNTIPVWLKYLIEKRLLRQLLGKLIDLWQKSGLQAIMRTHQWFHRSSLSAWEATLPNRLSKPPPTKVKSLYNSEVALFTGCITSLTERPTIEAIYHLLNICGVKVNIPKDQACCGAIYQHNGNLSLADKCMQHNLNTFADSTVITYASGCGLQWLNTPNGQHFDIHDFLLQFSNLQFNPLDSTIALHTPCTAKTKQQPTHNAVLELVQRIPQLNVKQVPDLNGCCGAGGTHILQQSDSSKQLAGDIIDFLVQNDIDTLLTTNTGCAMHLRRNLYERQINVQVIHPTVLLYQQHKTMT